MNTPQEAYQTIKIWVRTQRKLKLLSALMGKSMIEVLEELIEEKLKERMPRGDK